MRYLLPMHASLENLPIAAERPGFIGRWVELDGYHYAYQSAAAGSSLDAMLAPLPDSACPVEHWGYVFSGRVRIEYVDGSEEFLDAGDAFHVAPGHRPSMVEDTVMLQISRAAEHDALLAAVAAAVAPG